MHFFYTLCELAQAPVKVCRVMSSPRIVDILWRFQGFVRTAMVLSRHVVSQAPKAPKKRRLRSQLPSIVLHICVSPRLRCEYCSNASRLKNVNFFEKFWNTVMYTVPITPFACEHFHTDCTWCSFGVANDCLNYYLREFAKVISVPHHRVRADLPETSRHWVYTICPCSSLNCATMGKCYYSSSLVIEFT